MAITYQQMRKIMSEYQESGKVSIAALHADVDRKTAGKYLAMEQPWEEGRKARDWRTRKDLFTEHWPEVEHHLKDAPELEAKALFEWLLEQHPGVYLPGQVRSFQRQVRRWRALHGPDKEVYFRQDHKPGRRMQTDFTCLNELEITIHGEAFPHWACHSVLTYSNWEWATLCRSENYVALKQGFQAAIWKLGHVPCEHWTDHTTAATHVVAAGTTAESGWVYNPPYEGMMNHFGIQPRTIQVASPNENGDVESSNGNMKRCLHQHLLLRGSRDFQSREEWRGFFEGVLDKRSISRRERLSEELAVMKPLEVDLLPEYEIEQPRVSAWSTIQVHRTAYSVPSRLIGEKVRAHRYEDHVDVYYAGILQASMPRQTGRGDAVIDYRHIIDWLVRKPGAFRDYRYHEQMFPTLVFRKAYDQLLGACAERVADREYLALLQLAYRHGDPITGNKSPERGHPYMALLNSPLVYIDPDGAVAGAAGGAATPPPADDPDDCAHLPPWDGSAGDRLGHQTPCVGWVFGCGSPTLDRAGLMTPLPVRECALEHERKHYQDCQQASWCTRCLAIPTTDSKYACWYRYTERNAGTVAIPCAEQKLADSDSGRTPLDDLTKRHLRCYIRAATKQKAVCVTVGTVPPLAPGVTSGDIFLFSDRMAYSKLTIPVSATIAGDIVTAPKEITLSLSERPEPVTARVAMRSRTGTAFKILKLAPPDPDIKVDVTPIDTGGYICEIRDIMPFPALDGTKLVVTTDNELAREITIPIHVSTNTTPQPASGGKNE